MDEIGTAEDSDSVNTGGVFMSLTRKKYQRWKYTPEIDSQLLTERIPALAKQYGIPRMNLYRRRTALLSQAVKENLDLKTKFTQERAALVSAYALVVKDDIFAAVNELAGLVANGKNIRILFNADRTWFAQCEYKMMMPRSTSSFPCIQVELSQLLREGIPAKQFKRVKDPLNICRLARKIKDLCDFATSPDMLNTFMPDVRV